MKPKPFSSCHFTMWPLNFSVIFSFDHLIFGGRLKALLYTLYLLKPIVFRGNFIPAIFPDYTIDAAIRAPCSILSVVFRQKVILFQFCRMKDG